jgi:hypothetical protein
LTTKERNDVTTMTRVVLAFGAVLGVALGLALPAPGVHAHSHHLLTPGFSAQ